MRLERGLKGRDEERKRVEGEAGAIQELRGARLQIGKPYTGHRWYLLPWEAPYTINRDNLNFALPHACLRQPLAEPVRTHGMGSPKLWRPCTPAMVAGLTDHVWTLQEGLLSCVPPWPQAQLG